MFCLFIMGVIYAKVAIFCSFIIGVMHCVPGFLLPLSYSSACHTRDRILGDDFRFVFAFAFAPSPTHFSLGLIAASSGICHCLPLPSTRRNICSGQPWGLVWLRAEAWSRRLIAKCLLVYWPPWLIDNHFAFLLQWFPRCLLFASNLY